MLESNFMECLTYTAPNNCPAQENLAPMLCGEVRKGGSSLWWSPESLGITEQPASPYSSLPEHHPCLLKLYEAGGTDLS